MITTDLVIKRTVLISGASKGIGLAISQRLATKGYQVIGIARNNPDASYPGIFFPCDLNDVNALRHLVFELPNFTFLGSNSAGSYFPPTHSKNSFRSLCFGFL